jgi:hypothetical protein
MTKSRGINAPKKHWSHEERLYLEVFYPDMPNQALAEKLGVTLKTVYNAAKRFKLHKSAAFLASPASGRLDGVRGTETRFQKGCTPCFTPFVKGMHVSPATQFKKGQTPHNQQEVGALRINSSGDIDIKLAPGPRNWLSLRRYAWEQVHGPIPAGMCIVPINGDRHDTRIENLRLLTRAENIAHNLLCRYPKELRNLMALQGRVKTQIKRKEETQHA